MQIVLMFPQIFCFRISLAVYSSTRWFSDSFVMHQ